MVDVDNSAGDTFNKKIRNAQLAQYNYILGMCDVRGMHVLCVCMCVCAVVGEKEETNQTVNVRTRDNKVHGEHRLEDLLQHLIRLKQSRTNDDSEEFAK